MRRIIIAIVAALTLSAVSPGVSQAQCLDPAGDVDGNGVSNIVDVQCIIIAVLQWISGEPDMSQLGCLAGPIELVDLSCADGINVTDAILSIQYALEIPLSVQIDFNSSGCPDACESECDGFDSSDCPEGEKCVFAGNLGECYPAGVGQEGDPCAVQSDCAEGLICANDVCTLPECDTSGTIVCADPNQLCAPYTYGNSVFSDVGICYTPCDPFGVDQCEPGVTSCVAFNTYTVNGQIEGTCLPSTGGTQGWGSSCEFDACVDGLICVNSPTPTCHALCDPSALSGDPGYCMGGSTCTELVSSETGEPYVTGACWIDFAGCTALGESCALGGVPEEGFVCIADVAGEGVCREACTLAVDLCQEGQVCIAAGCEMNGFCAAETCSGLLSNDCGPGANCFTVNGEGECYFAVGVPEGGLCAVSSDCGMYLICVGAVCTAPECTTDGLAACPEPDQECLPLSYGPGLLSDVGECYTACAPFTEGECTPGETQCVPFIDPGSGAYLGQCVAAGFGAVGEGGACLDDSECVDGTLCVDGFCELFCASGSLPGDPGSCAAGETCAPLYENQTGEPLIVGICLPGCWPFQSPSGCGAESWCLANFGDATQGQCIDLQGSELALGQPCGGGAVCGAEMLCVDSLCSILCDPDAAEGDAGSCVAGEECNSLFLAGQLLDIGYCMIAGPPPPP